MLIRDLLRQKNTAGNLHTYCNKKLRDLKFYPADFTDSAEDRFSADDFDRCVEEGRITVG